MKTDPKLKHIVWTNCSICDLFIIKKKWKKTKKVRGFPYREMLFYIKDVFIQLKKTQTKTFNSQRHLLKNKTKKKEANSAKTKQTNKQKSANLDLFSELPKLLRYQTSETGSKEFPLWSGFHDQTGLRASNPAVVKWEWMAASLGERNTRVCFPF